MNETCFDALCFIALNPNSPKTFGFSEFLSGLALMVLAWTLADVRYRFRIQTAPLPIQGIGFAVVSAVGIATLLTDLWRAEGWLVPAGPVITPTQWQTLLGGILLVTFLMWMWFAFIRPPTFGKTNAKRYAHALYASIVKGNPTELAIVADELGKSVEEIVRHAPNRKLRNDSGAAEDHSDTADYANDILLLIADKRFCRAIVSSAPITALRLYEEVSLSRKYLIQLPTFSKNIVLEALENRDSFLYHETDGYESGLIGHHKPLSSAMFGNYNLVESVGTLIDPGIGSKGRLDAEQWEAYARTVLITFRDYVKNGCPPYSTSIYRAKSNIERAAWDLYKLNGAHAGAWDSDEYARLRVVVDFIVDAIEILDQHPIPDHYIIRNRDSHRATDIYDHIASMISEVIFCAGAIRSPSELCWSIQHNDVWGKLFNFSRLNGAAGEIVKFKLRRLLYQEVVEMRRFPNFKGAKILGFCLNVMGLQLRKERDYDRDSFALHKAILSWVVSNYSWLDSYNSEVAAACLVDGITFDREGGKLLKTYPAKGLRRETSTIELILGK